MGNNLEIPINIALDLIENGFDATTVSYKYIIPKVKVDRMINMGLRKDSPATIKVHPLAMHRVLEDYTLSELARDSG